jgi:L-threonylcarbamoyladenylate synthase
MADLPFQWLTVHEAATQLQQDQVVAYPTEAVYGLGCNPQSEAALKALLALKERPVEKGLILIAANVAQLDAYVDWSVLEPERRQEVWHSWPAPVTWVVPCRASVSPTLRGQHTTLAVRVSAHPDVIALCEAFGGALVSTSANLSAQPAALSPEDLAAQFAAKVDCLQGQLGSQQQPSQIRDARTGAVLRA